MMFISACVVTTQFVITLLASWAGRKAAEWGRNPCCRPGSECCRYAELLYTLTGNTGASDRDPDSGRRGSGNMGRSVGAGDRRSHARIGPFQCDTGRDRHGGWYRRFAQPVRGRLHRAWLRLPRGFSVPGGGGGSGIRAALLPHAGDTRSGIGCRQGHNLCLLSNSPQNGAWAVIQRY